MAELDVGQHCEVQHCRQRGDAGNPIPARGRAGPGSDGRGGGGGGESCDPWVSTQIQKLTFQTSQGFQVALPEKLWVADGVDQGSSPPRSLALRPFRIHSQTFSSVNIIKERPKTDEHKPYPCSFKDCTEVELVAVVCPYCEKNFCLRHRHQSDHGCEKLETPQPRMSATQKLVKDIIDSKSGGTVSKGRKGAKTSGTAAKVALMKLKMHADGDKSLPQRDSGVVAVAAPELGELSCVVKEAQLCFVPVSVLTCEQFPGQCSAGSPSDCPEPYLYLFFTSHLATTERIYFQVYLPKGSKEKSKAMFFCLRWSVGKVVDFAASLAGLRNENNKLMAKKLRLCHVPSGEALPLDHTLETWITKEDCPLHNGGNVILEYLNNEEQFLKNVDSYLE
ncbi:AN1-type zinc finger protein 1 [Microtus ochrogaster]|uniref:AN1-type zinc finger protein 1 n=1 Tax=Microtus ochrogaster TaxID=79684 RepID=A0A8J6G5M7_MICOH|nr:AN1-type zinc finger protein 1 [Microtus ochrogaster]